MVEERGTEIAIPYPAADDLHLRIAVGACRMTIAPGEGEQWVTGWYRDPTSRLPVRVSQEGGTARIRQDYDVGSLVGLLGGVPRFELQLGKARPYALTLEGGASENALDLGGLPLRRLTVKHGAGKLEIGFAAPNPERMNLLEVGTGAGVLDLRDAVNANFTEMRVEGGAASYRLDFGGVLQQDAHARISTGMSAVELAIPGSTAAKVSCESVMGNVDLSDGWTRKEGAFWTMAALAGQMPVLTVMASVALGTLRLRAT